MGRRASKPGAVPHLRSNRRKGSTWYYYDHGIVGGKRWREPLGSDYTVALRRWAEIEAASRATNAKRVTFAAVAEAYRREAIPRKAPRTQIDNMKELAKLLAFFNDPPGPLDAIEPVHVRQYLEWRSSAPVRANREKALLSHMWNWARERGYTSMPNPCAGIHGNRESGRDVYVTDEQFRAIRKHADDVTRNAMDLAYLTGQRPADVRKMKFSDVRDGLLEVRQGKTGAVVQIEVIGELKRVIDRIKAEAAKRPVSSMMMLANAAGHVIGLNALSRRFAAAMKAAGLSGIQLRDMRAKAATDKAEATGSMMQAQRQLGHTNVTMTQHYVRRHRGQRVTPTK